MSSVLYKLMGIFLCTIMTLPVIAEDLPISHFMKRPEISGLTISPDGMYVAAVIPVNKQKIVAILSIEDPLNAQIVQTYKPPIHEDAQSVFWLNDNRIAFSTVEEQSFLTSPRFTGSFYAGDVDGENKRQIAGEGSPGKSWVFLVAVVDMAPERPDEMLVQSYKPGDRKMRIEWLNVKTGKSLLADWSPFLETRTMITDNSYKARFALGSQVDSFKQRVMYRDADGDWQEFKPPFIGDIRVFGFSPDDRHAWVGSRDQEQFGLYQWDTQTMEYTLMATDPVAEVSDVIRDRSGDNVIGALFHTDLPTLRYFDSTHPDAALRDRMGKQFPGQYIDITSFSDDGKRATVFVRSDINPGQTYLYDIENNRLVSIGFSLPWVKPEAMAEMRPFKVTARDGLELHGYLTRPPGKEHKNLPMVTIVHGGPHGPRDFWGWNPEAQLLANRGYLVMQLNFRGSGGYGEQYEKSGYRRWGTTMQDDVTDATLWAVEQGLADRERLCIYGASYGGYATLAGITREPDLYKCGFAYAGVYDLELMKKSGDIARRKAGLEYLDEALGSDENDLRARSPVTHVNKIKSALFVAHGKQDDRADIKQYYGLIEALEEAGIPYKSLLINKEAHGFWDLNNQEKLYGEMLMFFEEHIGR